MAKAKYSESRRLYGGESVVHHAMLLWWADEFRISNGQAWHEIQNMPPRDYGALKKRVLALRDETLKPETLGDEITVDYWKGYLEEVKGRLPAMAAADVSNKLSKGR